jgi:hypothetical protein
VVKRKGHSESLAFGVQVNEAGGDSQELGEDDLLLLDHFNLARDGNAM